MVFSTIPGGMVPGTQMWKWIPLWSAWYSNARCGCPKIRRFQRGCVRPMSRAHQAAAEAASTFGGTATSISRAPGSSRLLRQSHNTHRALAQAAAAPRTPSAATGP